MKKNYITLAVLVVFVLVQTTTKIASASTTYTANELLTKIVQAENSLKWTVKNSFNKLVTITKNLKVKGNTTLGDSTTDTVTVHGTVTLNTPLAASNISSTGIVKGVTAGSGISIADSGNGSYAITNTQPSYTAGTGVSINSSNQISSDLGTSITSDEITDGTIAAADLANTAAVKGLTAGTNMTVTDNHDGTFTLASADTTGPTYTAGTGITITSNAIASTLGTSITNDEITDSTITDVDISPSAGILASKIANGLTDTQVNDNLTISGGLVDNTPIGATTVSTGNFRSVALDGKVSRVAALTQVPRSNTLSSLDTTNDVGKHSSMTIGSDGLGVMSYYDATSTNLKVAHCSNTNCTAATTATLDTPGNVGKFSSITIGADGFPLISYYDTTNINLKVAHCSDVACSGTIVLSIVDSSIGVGQYTSITIGTDGFGLISYYNADTNIGGQDLKVAHCSDTNCTTATLSIIDDVAAGGTDTTITGFYTSITIGVDGLGLISYYDVTNQDLKVAHCSDASCTTATLASLDTTGDVGQFTAITIGTDDLGLVSYYDVTNADLKVAHCSNTACTTATATSVDTTTGDMGEYSSITIGADGLPIVSYYDVTNGNLKVAKAANQYFLDNWTRR